MDRTPLLLAPREVPVRLGGFLSAVLAPLLLAGCAPGPAADESLAAGSRPTVTSEASFYFDVKDPAVWRTWGSALAVVEVTDERSITQTIEPGPGGQEDPVEDHSLRGLTLRVTEVAWTSPSAVTQLKRGVEIEVQSLGFTEDGRSALVLEGTTRMDVGRSYLVVLIDDVVDGKQTVDYLDGSAVEVSEGRLVWASDDAELSGLTTVAAVVEKVEAAPVDVTVPPARKGLSWGERIAAYVGMP